MHRCTLTLVSLCIESSRVIADVKLVIAFPFPCPPFILCHGVTEVLIDYIGFVDLRQIGNVSYLKNKCEVIKVHQF